jgi:hypothetical protein
VHIALVVDQSVKFRLLVQPRTKPIGTYTYIITRTDGPDWGETTAEYFFTREAALAAGRAALDRIPETPNVVRRSRAGAVPIGTAVVAGPFPA